MIGVVTLELRGYRFSQSYTFAVLWDMKVGVVRHVPLPALMVDGVYMAFLQQQIAQECVLCHFSDQQGFSPLRACLSFCGVVHLVLKGFHHGRRVWCLRVCMGNDHCMIVPCKYMHYNCTFWLDRSVVVDRVFN